MFGQTIRQMVPSTMIQVALFVRVITAFCHVNSHTLVKVRAEPTVTMTIPDDVGAWRAILDGAEILTPGLHRVCSAAYFLFSPVQGGCARTRQRVRTHSNSLFIDDVGGITL